MTETIPAPVQGSAPTQGVIMEAPSNVILSETKDPGPKNRDSSPSQAQDQNDKGESKGVADGVLAVVEDKGIDEGFDYVANGFVNADRTDKVQSEKHADGADTKVDQVEKAEKVEDPKEIEKMELQKEVAKLQEKVFELTEGQEGIRKEINGITRQLLQTSEITQATVLVLHALVQKLYEEEQDKRKKESLWMLLTKLAGFLATSLLSGPEEGEKILKKAA